MDDSIQAHEISIRLGLGTRDRDRDLNHGGRALPLRAALLARATWDEAIEFSRATGLSDPEMWTRGERLRALYHLGEWEDVEEEAVEVLRWVEPTAEGRSKCSRAWSSRMLHVHRGAVDARRRTMSPRCCPGRVKTAFRSSSFRAWRLRRSSPGSGGDEATSLAAVAELEADDSSDADVAVALPCVAGSDRGGLGKIELAQAFLDGTEQPAAWDRSARPAIAPTLAEARGNLGEAAALYREAAERFAEYGSVVERGYALLGLGRCGDAGALREGQAIFERLGAAPVLAIAA